MNIWACQDSWHEFSKHLVSLMLTCMEYNRYRWSAWSVNQRPSLRLFIKTIIHFSSSFIIVKSHLNSNQHNQHQSWSWYSLSIDTVLLDEPVIHLIDSCLIILQLFVIYWIKLSGLCWHTSLFINVWCCHIHDSWIKMLSFTNRSHIWLTSWVSGLIKYKHLVEINHR